MQAVYIYTGAILDQEVGTVQAAQAVTLSKHQASVISMLRMPYLEEQVARLTVRGRGHVYGWGQVAWLKARCMGPTTSTAAPAMPPTTCPDTLALNLLTPLLPASPAELQAPADGSAAVQPAA